MGTGEVWSTCRDLRLSLTRFRNVENKNFGFCKNAIGRFHDVNNYLSIKFYRTEVVYQHHLLVSNAVVQRCTVKVICASLLIGSCNISDRFRCQLVNSKNHSNILGKFPPFLLCLVRRVVYEYTKH